MAKGIIPDTVENVTELMKREGYSEDQINVILENFVPTGRSAWAVLRLIEDEPENEIMDPDNFKELKC